MTKTPIYQTHDPLGQIEIYEENGVRHLNFGSFAMQSAVGLNHSNQLHFAYTQTMMGALLFQDIADDNIFLIIFHYVALKPLNTAKLWRKLLMIILIYPVIRV